MVTSAGRKAAATRKRGAASGKDGAKRERMAVGRKAAPKRKSRPSGRKSAAAVNSPYVIPMISYEDGIAALEWLRSAIGFQETARLTTPDGRLSHGEMETGAGLIMLACPTPDYRSPKHHREVCEQARKWSSVPWIVDGVLVYVDDLDQHFSRAKAAGALILSEIEDGPPGRRYRAEDFEGHRWFFFEKDSG